MFFTKRLLAFVLVVSGLVGLVAGGCQTFPSLGGDKNNLLYGLNPSKFDGVQRPWVLTDGVAARTGDPWRTELTAVFPSLSAYVEYDLGRSCPLRGAFLQGDNNDSYVVSVSEDGSTFTPLWTAAPHPGGGLQERSTKDLAGSGRYVRITVRGGDRDYSVSEVQLYSGIPEVFPPRMTLRSGLSVAERVRTGILLFAFSVVVFFCASARPVPRVVRWGTLLLPLWSGAALVRALVNAWPVEQREVSLVRATAAGVAALVVLSEVLIAPRFRPNRRVGLGVLGLAAVAAMAAFFNLGQAQFWDHREGGPGFVHNFDMRVYYPVAKYFEELHFDGLYLASVAAYADDVLDNNLASVARVELRDLRTHHMTRVSDVEDQVRAVKERFSAPRWNEFKEDMRYFRETMGLDDYLGSMSDHGGNATPVWIAIARVFFVNTHASNATLLWGALLDPLLLLLMFGVIGRTFGVRTMLVSMIVFGANDFYMFGTNWAGATLRHDWLVYLGLGVCALKAERWTLGGVLLGLAAMIRAFPALALVGAAIPLGYWLWDRLREERRLPGLHEIWRTHPLGRIAVGAVACAFGAWLLSSLAVSFGSWSQWLSKVAILDRDPHVNDVSLRALIAGSGGDQLRVLQARMPLFVTAVVLVVVGVLAAARRKSWDQAAVLGTILVPVAFNPANYYLHFVCLLPLLAVEARRSHQRDAGASVVDAEGATIWLSLLALCAAQYWTVLGEDTELHFQLATVLFFAATTVILVVMARAGARSASVPVIPLARGAVPEDGAEARAAGS